MHVSSGWGPLIGFIFPDWNVGWRYLQPRLKRPIKIEEYHNAKLDELRQLEQIAISSERGNDREVYSVTIVEKYAKC